MAVIYKCDLCNNEINQGEENGTFTAVEKTTLYNEKHQAQSGFKKTESLFCSQCLKGINNYIAGQRNIIKK